MRSRGVPLWFAGLVLVGAAVAAWLPLGAQTGTNPGDQEQALAGEGGWPRKLTQDGVTFTVYLPQIEKWERNKLEARAALAIESKASPQQTFGVAWFSARTEVDKESRLVVLDDFRITKAGWQSFNEKSVTGSRATYDSVNRGLNTDLTTRRAGEASYNSFHSTSSFGGYTGAHATSVSGPRGGSVSGFRAGGARGGRR